MHIRRPCLAITLWALAVASTAAAQSTLGTASIARGTPNGPSVGAVSAGAPIVVGATKGSETQITIEGWVDGARLGGGKDNFAASVNGKRALRVRATPSKKAATIAELHAGVGVGTGEQKGNWTHVKRSMWVPTAVLAKVAPKVTPKVAPPAPATPPPPATRPAPVPAPKVQMAQSAQSAQAVQVAQTAIDPPQSGAAPSAGAMHPTKSARLFVAPSGAAIGDLGAQAVLEPIARDRGWVKVRLEGWVNERDLTTMEAAPGLTAADLHADPAGTRGRTVRWEVQVLSLQTADPLRREMARDEPYLLARGPGSENALLYLAIPPSLATVAATFPPMTTVIINAKVRSGKSEPSGAPILDLISITKR